MVSTYKNFLVFFVFATCLFSCYGGLVTLRTDRFVHEETLDIVVGNLIPGSPFWDTLHESEEVLSAHDSDNFCLECLYLWAFSPGLELRACFCHPMAELKNQLKEFLLKNSEIASPQLPRYMRKLNIEGLDRVVDEEIRNILQAIIVFDRASGCYRKLEGEQILKRKRGGEFEARESRDPSWA